jgi:hypothetical protein
MMDLFAAMLHPSVRISSLKMNQTASGPIWDAHLHGIVDAIIALKETGSGSLRLLAFEQRQEDINAAFGRIPGAQRQAGKQSIGISLKTCAGQASALS